MLPGAATERPRPLPSAVSMKIGDTLYFDHQATTPVDARVVAAMQPYFADAFGNPHSADHSLGWQAARAVEDAAERVATLIGADADEVVFTSGATESNNLALLGPGRRAAGGALRRILVSAIEHKCVLAASRALHARCGYGVESLPVAADGRLALSTLAEALDDDVLLVSVMAVNNEIGTIQDITGIAELLKEHGVLFHCDAAQGPCALDLRTIAAQVDLLSLSAHKMYGPKGVGALFIRRDVQDRIEPLIYGGGQQNDLRSGTVPTPLCVGMGVAADLLSGTQAGEEHAALRRRCARFVAGLQGLPWQIEVNGPPASERHPGNANVCFTGFSAHDVLGTLQLRLAASTGSACTSGMPEPSHVLRAIGLSAEDADASIRFSPGRFTTDADVDEAVESIGEALRRLSEAR